MVCSTSGSFAKFGSGLVLAAVLLASCAVTTEIDSTIEQPVGGTPTDSAPGGALMSSAEIYQAVTQSIVFIETTDLSTGSGIVVEGGWILTNAHVVDRLETVRIGRSDGVDLGEHEVVALDWIFDLALIGPIVDDKLVPMARAKSADLAIGDSVLLLGFPDEMSVDPTPTLTEGIVSRRRRPVLGDFPFLQVDATIAPGQSGGALINRSGDLMGISGLEFGQGEFGLALEADAMWPRVDKMLEMPEPSIRDAEAISTVTEAVGLHRSVGVLIETDPSGHVEVTASSDDDVFIDLQSLGGLTLTTSAEIGDVFEGRHEDTHFYVDDRIEGGEYLSADIDPGLYQIVVGSFGDGSGEVEVSSPNDLRRFPDVEEGAVLPVDEVIEGQFDWARDSDRWQLTLQNGDSVTIVTDGIADTILAVRHDDLVVASSDDEGLGLFGTGSRVEFIAPRDGVYEVEVGTFDSARWGYLIKVTIG